MPKQLTSVLQRTMAQIADEAPKAPEGQEESVLPDTPPSEAAESTSADVSGDEVKNFDKKQIEIALSGVEELKEVVNASGDLFMTVNGVRGYKIGLEYGGMPQDNQMITQETLNKPKKKMMESVCVFVWSKPNARVIEFLVSTAQSNNFKKILGFTDHAVIVSEYRM